MHPGTFFVGRQTMPSPFESAQQLLTKAARLGGVDEASKE